MTGILWENVRKKMDEQEWQMDGENEGRFRELFLGTVFGLFPSGKYYTPWACSNLNPCEVCKGKGEVLRGRRPRRKNFKKACKRYERLRDDYLRRFSLPLPEPQRQKMSRLWRRSLRYDPYVSCDYCGGIGSREAYEDEVYREELEKEASEHGFYVTEGEGDPCDIFLVEAKDEPLEEVEEEADEFV